MINVHTGRKNDSFIDFIGCLTIVSTFASAFL